MTNFSKNFFTEEKAEQFMETLKNNNCEDIQLWTGIDGFGQREYVVKWNKLN